MWLDHPEHGELPAKRLIDCVFALAPNGRILHFHVEQMEIVNGSDGTRFHLQDTAANPERAHCQIIPPVVNAFPQRARGDRTP
ncbi:MAG: hypothetical protein WD928_09850 [Gammaproteobacteria bacterium]